MKLAFPFHGIVDARLDFCFVHDPIAAGALHPAFQPRVLRMTKGPDPEKVLLYAFTIGGVDQLATSDGQPRTMAEVDESTRRFGHIAFDTIQSSSVVVLAGRLDVETEHLISFELEGEEVTA